MTLPPFSMNAIPAKDFRVDYLEEARKCLRAANRITTKYPNDWHSYPEFWANILGAVANSNVAAASEDVAFGLLTKKVEQQQERRRIREMLDEKLGSR